MTASNGIKDREELRRLGQFWTPDWIGAAMIRYAMPAGGAILDPAFGDGALYRSFRRVASGRNPAPRFIGLDVDRRLRASWRRDGLLDEDDLELRVGDFILDPPQGRFQGIVANPPYIRHHRLAKGMKQRTRTLCIETMGRPLDGRAGLHVFFLVQALRILAEGGRLAFIVPADTCEGICSEPLWQWICSRYRVECVLTFTIEAAPFPGIDTNAVVLFLRNESPSDTFVWAEVTRRDERQIDGFIRSGFRSDGLSAVRAVRRTVVEGLATGISRDPALAVRSRFTLGDFAVVRRGVVTGRNQYFFVTERDAEALGIPGEFLLPAVGRTRDVEGCVLDHRGMKRLRLCGRPTLLLALDGRPAEEFPAAVREYIRQGERNGLPRRAVLASRRPWYKMERREAPPILFAYLGRRTSRFVRNLAGVVPLNGFLCVYPRFGGRDFLDRLWKLLDGPGIADGLKAVGKSYGGGALKVEPRSLERLPLPEAAVRSHKLDSWIGRPT